MKRQWTWALLLALVLAAVAVLIMIQGEPRTPPDTSYLPSH